MSDAFEELLERLVPGSAHRGLSDAESPPFPAELGLEPISVLGRGSMGWVFKARDPILERDVAVKIARPEKGEAARDAVLHEARVTSRLAHPAILPVHQVRLIGELACVVFRRAPRLTLHRLLNELQHLIAAKAPAQRLRLLKEGAEAIAYAHRLGVVHGDLHPGNVAVGNAGEAYVLDWGGLRSVEGSFSGHPGYAAPEQLRGAAPTPASDVYTIAAVDWEALTLRKWRVHGPDESLGDALARFRQAHGEVGSVGLDPALDTLFEACLEHDPANRPSASEYVAGLESVLTGAAQLGRRRDQGRRLVERCELAMEEYQDLAERLTAEQRVAAVQEAKTPPYAPASQKKPLWETQDRIRDLIVEQEMTWVSAVEDGTRALSLVPDDEDARRVVADLWWARFRQAEAGASPAEIAMALSRVRRFDDGRYARLLEGGGRLSLTSSVPASARLFRMELADRRLHPIEVRGEALPLERLELEPGSWLVVVEAEGFVPLRYPIALRRQQHHRAHVVLRTRAEIGDGFVQIPAGPFHMGGDPIARMVGWRVGGRGPLRSFVSGGDPLARGALQSCEPTLEELFVQRTPVSSEAWRLFLDDLPLQEARVLVPGEAGLHGRQLPYWEHDGETWVLPEDWDPEWPVMGVSLPDVQAYARWLSERTGRALRPLREEEWEKAARGADGRPYPWGPGFDAGFAHMRSSSPGAPRPGPVGRFPVDTSVYGVQDMAGCIREWTSSLYDEGQVVVRGGSWHDDEDELRVASRTGLDKDYRSSFVGFRLISKEPAPSADVVLRSSARLPET